jgi:hypothetical protein
MAFPAAPLHPMLRRVLTHARRSRQCRSDPPQLSGPTHAHAASVIRSTMFKSERNGALCLNCGGLSKSTSSRGSICKRLSVSCGRELARLDRAIAELASLAAGSGVDGGPKRRGRKSMGPEERKQVSERMTKYWAGRRSQKK